MDIKELIEKISKCEITEKDVIIQKDNNDEEYDQYILNDGFDYWYHNGDSVISLSFLEEKDKSFEIISKAEFEKIIKEEEKQKRIKELERELKYLKEKTND